MSWLLNGAWLLWGLSAAVFLIERQRGDARRATEHARVQALAPEQLRGPDFRLLLTGPSPKSFEPDNVDRWYGTVLLVGLVLLAAAQGLLSSSH
jgi:hypothetical protein